MPEEKSLEEIEQYVLKELGYNDWNKLSDDVLLNGLLKGRDPKDPVVRGYVRVSSAKVRKSIEEKGLFGLFPKDRKKDVSTE